MRCTTMEISILTTFLQTSANEGVVATKGLKIYAFGSVLRTSSPADVDLVMVFDPAAVTIEVTLTFRHWLRRKGLDVFGLSFDICLLTEKEAQNNPFLEEEGAVRVFG